MSYGRRAKRIKLDSSAEVEPGGAEFFGLPEELIVRILSFLRVHELCRCALVCSQWRRFSHADSLWQRYSLRCFRLFFNASQDGTDLSLVRRFLVGGILCRFDIKRSAALKH